MNAGATGTGWLGPVVPTSPDWHKKKPAECPGSIPLSPAAGASCCLPLPLQSGRTSVLCCMGIPVVGRCPCLQHWRREKLKYYLPNMRIALCDLPGIPWPVQRHVLGVEAQGAVSLCNRVVRHEESENPWWPLSSATSSCMTLGKLFNLSCLIHKPW